jgi:hypothetical protein
LGDEKGDGMDLGRRVQVSVSRSIAAPAAKVFQVLADPANHPALDGSGMLRAAPAQAVPSQVGDTFTMPMYLPEVGDYLMLNRITAFEQDRQIAWNRRLVTRWPRETPGCRSVHHRDTGGASGFSLAVIRHSSPKYSTAPKPLRSFATPSKTGGVGSRPCSRQWNGSPPSSSSRHRTCAQ